VDLEVKFDREGVAWDGYPFAASTVYPKGRVAWSDVRDIDPDAAPPELRTNDGETLFVTAVQQDELRVRAEAAGVVVVRGPDVWSLLLEPFLDTTFDPPRIEYRNDRLDVLGVSAARRERIHARFGPLMVSYNIDSGLWDWTHLGLCSFLSAVNGNLVPDARLVPRPACQVRLYRWAMAIADRARKAARGIR